MLSHVAVRGSIEQNEQNVPSCAGGMVGINLKTLPTMIVCPLEPWSDDIKSYLSSSNLFHHQDKESRNQGRAACMFRRLLDS